MKKILVAPILICLSSFQISSAQNNIYGTTFLEETNKNAYEENMDNFEASSNIEDDYSVKYVEATNVSIVKYHSFDYEALNNQKIGASTYYPGRKINDPYLGTSHLLSKIEIRKGNFSWLDLAETLSILSTKLQKEAVNLLNQGVTNMSFTATDIAFEFGSQIILAPISIINTIIKGAVIKNNIRAVREKLTESIHLSNLVTMAIRADKINAFSINYDLNYTLYDQSYSYECDNSNPTCKRNIW